MLKFIFRLIVSLVGLFWVGYVLRGMEWSAITRSFSNLSAYKITGSFVLVIFIYVGRLVRLKTWCERLSFKSISWQTWISIYVKSIALGSLTPARVGDLSRIVLLTESGLNLTQRSKLVFLDKFADTLYIPIGLIITAAIVRDKLGYPIPLSLGVSFSALLAYVIIIGWLGRGIGFFWLLRGMGLTVFGFLCFIISNWILFHGVGIFLPILDVTAIIISVGALSSLPISIGGIGVREGSLVSLLGFWGVAAGCIPPIILFEFLQNIIFPIILYLLWTGILHVQKR